MNKIYMALCHTGDPESGESFTRTLGVFTTKEAAEESFTRKELRTDKGGGAWTAYHTCYYGSHEVKEFELDKWYPLGMENS